MLNFFGSFANRYLKTDRQQAFFEFFLVVFLLVLLLDLVTGPAFSSAYRLQQNLAEAQRLNQNLDQKLVSLSQAKENFDRVLGDLTILDNALPTKSLILDFLNGLSSLAAADSVNLVESFYQEPRTSTTIGRSFDPQSKLAQSGSSASSFPFTVRLKGDYLHLRKFFGDLEKLPRLLVIDNFDFNKEAKGDSLEVLLSGRAFWLAAGDKP